MQLDLKTWCPKQVSLFFYDIFLYNINYWNLRILQHFERVSYLKFQYRMIQELMFMWAMWPMSLVLKQPWEWFRWDRVNILCISICKSINFKIYKTIWRFMYVHTCKLFPLCYYYLRSKIMRSIIKRFIMIQITNFPKSVSTFKDFSFD